MNFDEEYFKYDKISKHQIDVKTQKLINLIKTNNAPNLNEYSIVGNIHMDRISEILSSMCEKKSRALGCYMGMVIGDAMGAPLEFSNLNYNHKNIQTHMHNSEKFGLKAGQFTDDTSMGLCLTDSLLIKKHFDPHDVMLRYLAWWHCGYNNAFRYDYTKKIKHSIGLGGNISGSFMKFKELGLDYTPWGCY